MLIRIIPVGNVPGNIINAVRSEFPYILNAKCKVLEPLQFPKESYNHWRKQFDAEKILEILSEDKEAKYIDEEFPTLFLVDKDIYYKNLNFVFGLENQRLNASVVSIARLDPEFYEKKTNLTILGERVVKECVHEVGHHLGLKHCTHVFCVMSYSPSVEDVDKKEKFFCKDCKIKAAMRGINLD